MDFRATLVSAWLRLISVAIFGFVFAELVVLASGEAEGWTFFLRLPQVAFELFVRVIAAALAGVALGTICTTVLAPILWHFKSSRERLSDGATSVATVVCVFLVSRFTLEVLRRLANYWFGPHPTIKSVLLVSYFLAFVAALCIPRTRREVATSLDGLLGEKVTRRTAIATLAGTAALVTTEFALNKTLPTVRAGLAPKRPKSNFMLITFDALSAEDISLYKYRLPTTPEIDSFARKGTVFTRFYSASTFTTPAVATIMTGLYPSENHVYQAEGRLGGVENNSKSLPHLMRAAGYATGAFISNPLAYYLAKSLENDFDVLPEPIFQGGASQILWDATRPLHQDSGIGNRFDEYWDLTKAWNAVARQPDLFLGFRADATFEHARQVLAKLPNGHFLWIHVMTPHAPYLPDAVDRGRFISDAELQNLEAGSWCWHPHYEPDQQSQVDRLRRAYNEFIATGDRAFGAFMSELENAGGLNNTTVIVSADHGESFEGGDYGHDSPYQTRATIHVPLIIRTPGQREGRSIAFTADQTALAPTILELAGIPKPEWMHGESLVSRLKDEPQGQGEGLAFCQFFETNSVFKPLHHGTVGVVDGDYQYVVYLDTQKGQLRALNQAQYWNLDRSAEYPERAAALRGALHSRFPHLVQPIT